MFKPIIYNFSFRAKVTFNVSARGASRKVASKWDQSRGFCYNCFAAIGRCFEPCCMKLRVLMMKYCSPCYLCFVFFESWCYKYCFSVIQSDNQQEIPRVLENLSSDTSFEPLPPKPKKLSRRPFHKPSDQKRRYSDNYILEKRSKKRSKLTRDDDEDEFEPAPNHKRHRFYSDDYVLAPQHRRKSRLSDKEFELVAEKSRKSATNRASQLSDKLYHDASSHHRKDSNADYVHARDYFSKSSNRRSRISNNDEFHMARESLRDRSQNKKASYISYDKFHDLEAAPARHQNVHRETGRLRKCPFRKKMPHPSGGKATVDKLSFSPQHDISGRFFVQPQLPKRNQIKTKHKHSCIDSTSEETRRCHDPADSKLMPGPLCLYSTKQKCGLHCIQTQHFQPKCTSSECCDEMSSTLSSHASSIYSSILSSSTTSVTSLTAKGTQSALQKIEKDVPNPVSEWYVKCRLFVCV